MNDGIYTAQLIETNNHACDVLDTGDLRSAVRCFHRALSSLRAYVEEVDTERRPDDEYAASDPRIVPLPAVPQAVVAAASAAAPAAAAAPAVPQVAAVQAGGSAPAAPAAPPAPVAVPPPRHSSTSFHPRATWAPGQLMGGGGGAIHATPFRMIHHVTFAYDSLLNRKVHMAIVLFNLGLTLHRQARESMMIHGGSSSSSSTVYEQQAMALYTHARTLLGAIAFGDYYQGRPTGNCQLDLLLLAVLNNLAVATFHSSSRRSSCSNIISHDTMKDDAAQTEQELFGEAVLQEMAYFASTVAQQQQEQQEQRHQHQHHEAQNFLMNAMLLGAGFPKSAPAA